MLPLWAQWAFGIAAPLGVVVLIVGGFYGVIRRFNNLDRRIDAVESRLDRRVDAIESGIGRRVDAIESRMDRRFDGVGRSLNDIRNQGNNTIALIGSLISSLVARSVLTGQDSEIIIRTFAEMGNLPPSPTNPLLHEEQQRLDSYVALARSGGPFTPDQVEDFKGIIEKLQEEHPDDPSTWGPLAALAALLVGLYLIRRSK